MGVLCAAMIGAAVDPTCEADAAPLGLNGEVEWESFGYSNPETRGPRWENFFAATLRGRGDLVADVKYSFDFRAVADDVQFTAGVFDPRNANFRRPYLAFKELFLSYRLLPDLRLSVGKQLVHWSVIEELEPANLMDPRDESDPFRRWEEGVDSVALGYEHDEWSGELVVVPLAFTPSRAPQGRWQIIPPEIAQYQDLPPVRFDETQVGGRLRRSFGSLEAGVFGYAGRSTEAIFVPQLTFVGGDQVFRLDIVQRFPHLYAGGAQATYPLRDDILWRAEVVYYHSPDPDQDDLLHSATGVEYVLESWRLLVSYLRQDVTAYAPDEVTDKGALQFFRSFVFGEMRYDPGTWWRVSVRGGHDFTENFTLLQPEISAEAYQNLRLTLEGDWIEASAGSYFYEIRHNSRVGLRVEYFF